MYSMACDYLKCLSIASCIINDFVGDVSVSSLTIIRKDISNTEVQYNFFHIIANNAINAKGKFHT